MEMINRRALLAAAMALTVLVAAGSVQAADMSPADVAKGYLAAWNEKDADKAAGFLTDDVEMLDVTLGEPHIGRDAARDDVIKVFMTAAPDLSWQMKGEPIVSDDGIAFEWTFSGTNTGAWGPETPATNKPFSFQGVTFLRVKDGKIAYQGVYYDGYGFQKQLGWIQ